MIKGELSMALFDCTKINLKWGSNNEQVKTLQNALKTLGYYTRSVDGDFKQYTDTAVKQFQRKYNLSDDGVVGPVTCKKLNDVMQSKSDDSSSLTPFDCSKISLQSGSKGQDVLKLQTYLRELGYYPTDCKLDGDFGPYTDAAVKQFQTDTHNTSDGVFAEKTCKSLTETIRQNASGGTAKPVDWDILDVKNQKLTGWIVFLADVAQPPSDSVGEEASEDASKTTSKSTKQVVQFTESNLLSVSGSIDSSGLSQDFTVKLYYNLNTLNKIRLLQKTELTLQKAGHTYIQHKGYINNIKVAQENNYSTIELTLSGYNAYLDQTVEHTGTMKQSEHIKQICEKIGLKANVNTAGLPDENYEIKEEAKESDGTSTGTDSGATSTRAEIFAKAAKWSYGCASHQDPETAYKWTEAHQCGDCYCASASLYYQIKNFAKLPVRIVQGYSSYSKSGTHRTIQIKENGVWTDPPEYSNMTKMLRVLKNSRSTVNGYIWEGE